jgi:hypothetical protein
VTPLLLLPLPATPADPYSPAWQEQQPAQPTGLQKQAARENEAVTGVEVSNCGRRR